MNTPQSRIIYLLNGLMTSYIAVRGPHYESLLRYNVGYEKCATLFWTITNYGNS